MNKPKISLIVAIDDKNGIGKNNGLMWHIPEELKHFREITTGHPIIMGRKTHESIGKALPNRTNIVITRDKTYQAEGCIIVHSLEEAILEASKVTKASKVQLENNHPHPGEDPVDLRVSPSASGEETAQKLPPHIAKGEGRGGGELYQTPPEIFIIGGGEIYNQAIKQGIVKKIYLTRVEGDFKATVFFPDHPQDTFNVVYESEKLESNGLKYQFFELERYVS